MTKYDYFLAGELLLVLGVLAIGIIRYHHALPRVEGSTARRRRGETTVFAVDRDLRPRRAWPRAVAAAFSIPAGVAALTAALGEDPVSDDRKVVVVAGAWAIVALLLAIFALGSITRRSTWLAVAGIVLALASVPVALGVRPPVQVAFMVDAPGIDMARDVDPLWFSIRSSTGVEVFTRGLRVGAQQSAAAARWVVTGPQVGRPQEGANAFTARASVVVAIERAALQRLRARYGARLSWKTLAMAARRDEFRFAMADPFDSPDARAAVIAVAEAYGVRRHGPSAAVRKGVADFLHGQVVPARRAGTVSADYLVTADRIDGAIGFAQVLSQAASAPAKPAGQASSAKVQTLVPEGKVPRVTYQLVLHRHDARSERSYERLVGWLKAHVRHPRSASGDQRGALALLAGDHVAGKDLPAVEASVISALVRTSQRRTRSRLTALRNSPRDYGLVCDGGIPGRAAPQRQATALARLWLGRRGAGPRAGCAEPARSIAGDPGLWWARGYCGSTVASLGLASPRSAVLFRGTAARYAAAASAAGELRGGSTGRSVAGRSLSVVETRDGAAVVIEAWPYVTRPRPQESFCASNDRDALVRPALVTLWLYLVRQRGWVWPVPEGRSAVRFISPTARRDEAIGRCSASGSCRLWLARGSRQAISSVPATTRTVEELLANAPPPLAAVEASVDGG